MDFGHGTFKSKLLSRMLKSVLPESSEREVSERKRLLTCYPRGRGQGVGPSRGYPLVHAGTDRLRERKRLKRVSVLQLSKEKKTCWKIINAHTAHATTNTHEFGKVESTTGNSTHPL